MTVAAVIASILLAALHVLGGRIRFQAIPRNRWLSAAGGIAVAYVFVQLLPELAEASRHVGEVATAVEHPAYLLALLGLALFYGVERYAKRARSDDVVAPELAAWWSLGSYSLYNAIIGYVLVRHDRTWDSLLLFAVAMGVHFLVNDRALREHHGEIYHRSGRWVVAAAIVVGAVIGVLTAIHQAVVGALIAFVAGGVVLNVMKEELPEERRSSFGAFAVGAAGYAALLVAI